MPVSAIYRTRVVALAAAWLGSSTAADGEPVWDRLVDEAARLEARLALGELDDGDFERTRTIDRLLARGDALLRGAAPARDPAVAALEDAGEELFAATGVAMAAVSAAKSRASREALAAAITARRLQGAASGGWAGRVWSAVVVIPPGVAIDPWAGPEQECGFVPDDLGPVTTPRGNPFATTPFGDLPRLIPPIFRLAEVLGLGRNRLTCRPTFFDPIQVRRPGSGPWRIATRARLHCELTIVFECPPVWPVASQFGRLGPGFAARRPPFEEPALRAEIVSRGRWDATFTQIVLPAGSRQHYGLGTIDIEEHLVVPKPWNPWFQESLPAAVAEHGRISIPAADAADPANVKSSRVRDAVEATLADVRALAAETVAADSAVRRGAAALLEARKRFLDATAAVAVADATPAIRARAVLETAGIDGLIAAGRLDERSLGRAVRATSSAIASVARWDRARAVPEPDHARATQLARALDSLAAWDLR